MKAEREDEEEEEEEKEEKEKEKEDMKERATDGVHSIIQFTVVDDGV